MELNFSSIRFHRAISSPVTLNDVISQFQQYDEYVAPTLKLQLEHLLLEGLPRGEMSKSWQSDALVAHREWRALRVVNNMVLSSFVLKYNGVWIMTMMARMMHRQQQVYSRWSEEFSQPV